MKKNSSPFKSSDDIENWIISNLNDGVNDEEILNFLIEKKEELRSNADFYLQSRRLALITGDTETASGLHNLLKSTESELNAINKVLLNSFYITAKTGIKTSRKSVFEIKENKDKLS